ncbi:hypothetical protein F511_23213 [Dorcoceras hygrometricum]|uniref:Uncharacterized protein n=1 Tax=Dorcoceras hygrometricum TaxID=472368 RepID=A0A2Z7AFA1_9LAMI|nr:hypothetical protein F511_23213 [Dorcoceras hygrometricum]
MGGRRRREACGRGWAAMRARLYLVCMSHGSPRDTVSRGPTTIVTSKSQFRTCPTDHDSIGYPRMSASGESSTTMHRLLHASGSHPIPTPYDPKLFPESSGFLAGLVVAQYKMPPRRRGRSRGLFQESGGQNEDQYSAPSHTLESSGEEEAAAPPAPVERMDVVIARFQRMSPPIFNGDESSEDADSWLHSVIHLFDRAQYDDDLRLSFEAKAGRWRKTSRSAFCNAADALVNCVVVAGEETSRGTSREFSSVFCVERYTSSFGVLRLRYFQPFVPYLLNPRTLFSRELSGDFPSFLVVVLLVRGFYQSLRDFSQGCEGERQYRTLVSLLGSLAAMRRVVNYHSSWARQQQVELFDASGNPGSTAGRGFNPAGGAPGGG